jgi:hypothetical protein
LRLVFKVRVKVRLWLEIKVRVRFRVKGFRSWITVRVRNSG